MGSERSEETPQQSGVQEIEDFQARIAFGTSTYTIFSLSRLGYNPEYEQPYSAILAEGIAQKIQRNESKSPVTELRLVERPIWTKNYHIVPISSLGHNHAAAWALYITNQIASVKNLDPGIMQARTQSLRTFVQHLTTREKLRIAHYTKASEKQLIADVLR